MTDRRNAGPAAVITVGVDGSAVSVMALAWAVDDAALRKATLRVVTAWSLMPPGGTVEPAAYPWTDEDIEKACHAMLDHALATVKMPALMRVEQVVRSGRPADVLEAATADADVLVVGARGGGGFSRLRLGSVSSRCAQHSKRPVVVVRRRPDAVGSDRPVLCGVDGSPESRAGLSFAAQEAALRGLPLLVVHALHWDLIGIDLMRPQPWQLHQWGRQVLTETLEDVLGTSVQQPVDARIVEGHPAEVLVDLSRDASLLVVGTRGRSAIAATLLGSVSSYCLRRVECPVAVVPAASKPADRGGSP